MFANIVCHYKHCSTAMGFDKASSIPAVLPLDPRSQLRPCCLPLQPLDPEQGGACNAGWIAAGSRAAGVNHMNVPPEQIGSGEAGRPGRPWRSAQLHALTSKAVPKGVGGWRELERDRGLGQTLQRALWVMPALICGTAKLNDDVIAGLRAKSALIQIKVEVFPCLSGVRKILWVFVCSPASLHCSHEEVTGHLSALQ